MDTAVFAEVQAGLQHFKCEKKVFKEYPLHGKVFCGCCHHALIHLAKKVPVFQCKHSKIDSNFECHGLEITESELESVLFDMLAKQAQVILNLDGLTNLGKLELQIIGYAVFSCVPYFHYSKMQKKDKKDIFVLLNKGILLLIYYTFFEKLNDYIEFVIFFWYTLFVIAS